MSESADFGFLKKWPFGVLMASQTLLSLAGIINYHCTAFKYEGTGFVISFLPFVFVSSLIYNVIHVFGYHRKIISIFGRPAMIPATFLVFISTVISFVAACISTLILTINFIDSLRFSARLIVSYAFFLIFILLLTLACGKLLILLFRAAPNGQIRQLTQVVIEGERTAKFTAATSTTTTTVTTTTTTNFV